MEKGTKRILLCGLGFFEKELLKALTRKWEAIAVDMDKEKIRRIAEEFPEVHCQVGDISSVLTWRKFDANEIGHVISAVQDLDVNLEVCMIVREILKSEAPITILAYRLPEHQVFKKYGVSIVNPVELGINYLLNKLEKNYVKASDIGLKRGEMIEVPILAKSNLVGRKLKLLRPANWHVAAIYREGEMLIPTGETEIEVGDNVVLLGDPKVLENVSSILLRGAPQFPRQFGATVVAPLHPRFGSNTEELLYLRRYLKVQKTIGHPYKLPAPALPPEGSEQQGPGFPETGVPIKSLKKLFTVKDDIGLVFIPFSSLSLLERILLRNFLKTATKPFLFSKQQFPYQSITASLNCPDPAYELEFAMDLSRLFGIPLQALYVAMPKELRENRDEDLLKERKNFVSDFESIYKQDIPCAIIEGNPVKATISFLRGHERTLLVLLYSKKDPFHSFQPHVQHLIAKKSPASTLLIPLEAIYAQ